MLDGGPRFRVLLTLLESLPRKHLVCHKDREASARGMGQEVIRVLEPQCWRFECVSIWGTCPTGHFSASRLEARTGLCGSGKTGLSSYRKKQGKPLK